MIAAEHSKRRRPNYVRQQNESENLTKIAQSHRLQVTDRDGKKAKWTRDRLRFATRRRQGLRHPARLCAAPAGSPSAFTTEKKD